MFEPKRPYLVIVRAGDRSLHPGWLADLDPAKRNWDLVVNYFGDDPDRYRNSDCVRIDSKGPKWPALAALLEKLGDVLPHYGHVWLPDDDLAIRGIDINRFFTLCEREQFALAQPSLDPDSYGAHLIVVHNPVFRFRLTSFVEVMAPCFDRDTLRLLEPTFAINLSGWGLDNIVWPALLGQRRVAVVDAVQMVHTRPLGGTNYGPLAAQGVKAEEELRALRAKYGVKRSCYRVWGGELAGGGTVRNRFTVLVQFTLGLARTVRRLRH